MLTPRFSPGTKSSPGTNSLPGTRSLPTAWSLMLAAIALSSISLGQAQSSAQLPETETPATEIPQGETVQEVGDQEVGDQGQANDTTKPTPRHERTLDYWAGQLSHPRFLRRQSARRYLIEGGQSAVPVLKSMIESGDLETVENSISILAKIAEEEDPWTTDGAIGTLESLANRKFGAKAAIAKSALKSFAEQRGLDARIHLADAGVFVGTDTVALGSRSSPRSIVRIDARWDRKIESLAWLRWVAGVGFVMIEDVEVTPQLMESIIRMPDFGTLVLIDCKLDAATIEVLQRPNRIDAIELRYITLDENMLSALSKVRIRNALFLMGTGISDDRFERLRVELPGLEITNRLGGFLGVLCRTTLQDTCEVSEVMLGSGAQEAGLRAGDTIIRIDGVKITRFEDLQMQINTHEAGDEIAIRYRRHGEVFDAKATLKKQQTR